MKIEKYTIVIIEQNLDSFIVKCAYCQGTGKVLNDNCSVCNGMGNVRLIIQSNFTCEDNGILKCAYCYGRGSYGSRPCPNCKGVGSFIKCFPRIECTNCKGSGKEIDPDGYDRHDTIPCRMCNGVGSVWIGDLKAY